MRNVWSSINDPLFFMHHAQIDHVWALWQNTRPENAHALDGPIYPNGTGAVTMDYPLYMTPFIAPDQPISAVIDTQNRDGSGILCYVYEEDGHELPTPS
jgi:tyrosinase